MVAQVPRNQVDMQVWDSLTCGCSVVDSNIEPVWVKLVFRCQLCFIKQRLQCLPFFCSCLKKRSDMTSRNDQTVTGRYWVTIAYPDSMFVMADDAVSREHAERAKFLSHWESGD